MALIALVGAGFLAALLAVPLFKAFRNASWLLALVPLGITTYLLTQLDAVADGRERTASYEWVPTLGIDFSLRLDGLSMLFALLIAGIGALVVLYAGAYMRGTKRQGRFFMLLFVFMASMLGVVLADDLITLFVFWELTSISSFGLIGFESSKESARTASLQALLVTSGGGLAMLAGFVLLGIMADTSTISALSGMNGELSDHHLYLPMLILVFVGAFTKSAQFPFSFWLPNAMEAPTPVSAFLHSATMVKAGVYLLARLNPALGGTDVWEVTLAVAGIATMILGAVLTLRETDLKRILAYSTLAVLGTLVLLIGVGTVEATLAVMVMLFAHALYKAALFMLAGIIEHETGTRNIERLGGFARAMPVTAVATGLAAASMGGVAFFIGFVAKEGVYEAVQAAPRYPALITTAVLIANVLLVAVALLMVLKPFFGRLRTPEQVVHEAGWDFLAGPLVLCVLGALLGLLPGSVDSELLVPAAAVSAGDEISSTLSLWHGINLTLILTGLTLAGGVIAYMARPTLQQWLTRGSQSVSGYTPEALYNASIVALNRVAVLQTRVLQHGYLRGYVATVMAAAAFLAVGTMLRTGAFDLPETTSGMRLYEPVISLVTVGGALIVVTARTRVVAAIGLGLVGYSIALLYLLFGAPDLALTQVLVETLLVLLFVFAFYRLPRFTHLTTAGGRIRDATFCIGIGVAVMALMTTALSIQQDPVVSDTISKVAKPVGHGSNIVNVILVDIRALDTLGEISVLLIAAVGVIALLRLGPIGRGNP